MDKLTANEHSFEGVNTFAEESAAKFNQKFGQVREFGSFMQSAGSQLPQKSARPAAGRVNGNRVNYIQRQRFR